MTIARAAAVNSLLIAIAGTTLADDFSTRIDPGGDAFLRRADFGADGQVSPDSVLPDILALRIGSWKPAAPSSDLYAGAYLAGANFFRADLVLTGLINPPGPLGVTGAYDPFQFGPSPIYGYVDFDVDADTETAGELSAVSANRFLANVARFGSIPDTSLGARAARFGTQVDYNFATSPQYERSGAEFAMTFCGCSALTIISESGDADGRFESGETWVVQGRFFERFTAFNSASSMFGGSVFGAWNPLVRLRFAHDPTEDTTTITLVFPLNQNGAGEMAGAAPEPIDFNVANQTSVAEALNELVNQPSWISGPLRTLAIGWKSRNVSDGLNASTWAASAIVGTAYALQDEAPFVWTDAGFDMVRGDFNGDGYHDSTDEAELLSFIATNDGGAGDADGTVNGRVAIDGFGVYFAIYDTNYDGVVSAEDWEAPTDPADVNGDTSVDILDFLDFLAAFSECENKAGPCIVNNVDADFNHDLYVDILDFLDFLDAFTF